MASFARFDLCLLAAFQIIILGLYIFLVDYDAAADASIEKPKTREMDASYPRFFQCAILVLYPAFCQYQRISELDPFTYRSHMNGNDNEVFQDIHVMIFIGFGFLMTFLKRYGYSAVGFNLLLAALSIQWAVLCRGFFQLNDGKIKIGMKSLMGADIAAASVLISMGALLGQTTFLQLTVMGMIEIAIFAVNEYLVVDIFKVSDVGGSIVVHTFGAYFGLMVSFMLRPSKENFAPNQLEGATYNSDIFAMIGTVFLWIFWPSFNGGLVKDDEQYRAIINTYISLAACTVTAFVVSAVTSSEKKFDMVHVQNSTLAGGVAVGSVCNMMLHPFGAMLAGMMAGILSVLGYKYLTPIITSKLRLRDTCGVHNLHGMPGVLSGLLSVLLAFIASTNDYHNSLYSIFPAMKSTNDNDVSKNEELNGRTSGQQACYQLLGLAVTLGVAMVSGIITGLLLKTPLVGTLPENNKYDDEFSWEVPEEDTYHSISNNHNKSNQDNHNNQVELVVQE